MSFFDPFNPTDIADADIDALCNAIMATERDASVPERGGLSGWCSTFGAVCDAASLLKAGCRVLVPGREQLDVMPSLTIFLNHPQDLRDYARKYGPELEAGQEGTAGQKADALMVIFVAAKQLSDLGYKELASTATEFAKQFGAELEAPRSCVPPPVNVPWLSKGGQGGAIYYYPDDPARPSLPSQVFPRPETHSRS